ncbi:prepilin-type N-terminal cleavage/methylation domain-containing protein [Acinetobacter sp.]|uniref:pilus assembly FimT family protein n=1 Tax=Acinetobacter sp. TaxID=472 RepID=UPI002821F10B|nr:prepilin-type N-terminal cleavage/methylation domain-containing protein [Acinetobacter sp.]MDR0237944.1 prepilin-type N-terminal cleavage/methylation domain-containing protein [Acinetobacter sp.]
MRNNRGFTLVELIVTLIIISIIAVIAAPKVQDLTIRRKLERTSVDLEKILTQARSDAVVFRKKVTVNLNAAGKDSAQGKYWNIPSGQSLVFKTGVCNTDNNGKKTWGYSSTIPTLTKIVFLPQGNVEDFPQNLEIQISSSPYSKYVYLTNFGKVTTTNKSNFDGDCTS